MKKSLVLAMAMALGVTASAYAANPFSDVPAGHWAYDSISKLAAAGVIEGYGDATFGGDKLMTRYEMAQIVAKAMAKGANCDKLAAEFADELDNLGVRVANLEKKADNVKITGQIRTRVQDYHDGSLKDAQTYDLRTRLFISGQVNDDWSYTGMIENTQDFGNAEGEETTKLQRAYVAGKLGGLKVEAGRNHRVLADNNVYANRVDGVKVAYGKDVKLTAEYGKLASADGITKDTTGDNAGNLKKSKGGKYAAVGLAGTVAGIALDANYIDVKGEAGTSNEKDRDIWTIGAKYKVTKDLGLNAMYLKGDIDNTTLKDDDGYVVGLTFKGASAAKAGSWGLYANYYDQSKATYIHHGMTTDAANDMYKYGGFKGWNFGAKYAVAKNIVTTLEYVDFEAKEDDKDTQVIWADVTFTF